MKNRIAKKMLCGLGFDNKDGHKRITKGENFSLFGGSKKTHEQMQEKAIKFNEHLKKKGKTLDEIGKEEFTDIAQKSGMNILTEKDDEKESKHD